MKAKETKQLIVLFDKLCFLRGYYHALEYSDANEKKRSKLIKRSLNLERIIEKLI